MPKSIALPPGASAKRPRGRPRNTDAQNDQTRQLIKDAAARVYGAHGYHGLSVELILQASGLSRPTFYKYFQNAHEVIDLVLREVNHRLASDVLEAVQQEDDLIEKVEAGLRVWRAWGKAMGPMLKSVYAELYDPESPASVHRGLVLRRLSLEIGRALNKLRRNAPPPLLLETFLHGVEYLGYQFYFGPRGPSAQAWVETRQAVLRLAVGLMGTEIEWSVAVELASALGIELNRAKKA